MVFQKLNPSINNSNLSVSSPLAMACVAFFSSLIFSLILVPIFRKVAIKLDLLDKPGGRKKHETATPLLGGVGVLFACTLALITVIIFERYYPIRNGVSLNLLRFKLVFLGSLIIFMTGLIDDLFGERMPFYFKLIGQIIGTSLAMAFVFFAYYFKNFEQGDVTFGDYVYLLIFMGWMLTTINSFNFSDNLNGLSSGLAVIALLIALVYLGALFNLSYIMIGFIIVGSILGFMPYNFPKARVFLGDAGSMFVGYWIGIILWPLGAGFFDGMKPLFGLDNMIPPLLLMGIPLYDAAFVVVMRWREKRPIYLGDDQHLSHRLVRGGFTKTETTLVLWGLALMLGGVGAMSLKGEYVSRYMSFFIGLSFMLIITVLIVKKEIRNDKLEDALEGDRNDN